MKKNNSKDTIVATATPPGQGGVGVIRISGPKAQIIAATMLSYIPKPRLASLQSFCDKKGEVIDKGIVLFFPAPHSFTGEDVIELQGHAGPVVMDRLLQCLIASGARLARPGEFSERAFLNDKIDLSQAEAIADLITSQSVQAARSAMQSLQGVFSKEINELVAALIELRMHVEACIDFPEEEIDFLADEKVKQHFNAIKEQLNSVLATAQQGRVLRDGLRILILGKPNVGKSSLLNYLAGHDAAIVTEFAGTTRDVMREYIQIDGLPIHIIDTAGLRDSPDKIEQEGIRRAANELESADHVLWIMDSINTDSDWATELNNAFLEGYALEDIMVIENKIDLQNKKPSMRNEGKHTVIALSIKTGEGMELLRERLKTVAGFEKELSETQFIARRRHLEALETAEKAIQKAESYLLCSNPAGELLAEECRLAQVALGEITGKFTADDLLGKIFSEFCIGK